MGNLDYLDHLARDSDRFADVLTGVDPARTVPSCPDWTAVDLLWHLTEVQWFWGTIVRERLTDPAGTDGRQPERPTDLDALLHLFATVSGDLHDALEATPADTPVWTWSADKTTGFVRRRQAHEALIHRVDAELTADDLTSMDPALASDGVDEALRVMHGGIPDWGTFDRDGTSARVQTTDTAASWTLALGRFAGTDPDSDRRYDQALFEVVDEEREPAATVRGPAADLDRWLWGRLAADRVERSGDDGVLANLQAVIDQGID